MASWPVQDAKARFSELLDTALEKGPQVVTRRGVETAVVVPIEEWKWMKKNAPLSVKECLLLPEPRFDLELPDRHRWRRRPPIEFE